MRSRTGRPLSGSSGGNTVIGVVAINARLTKEEAGKMAQMAQDGLARAIRPAHTMLDGDTISRSPPVPRPISAWWAPARRRCFRAPS